MSRENPKHDEPCWEWAQRILANTLGNGAHGKQLYRFVWGEDRCEWVGGKWEDRDENTGEIVREVVEQRLVPKYSHLGTNHWFVERWYPAEHYGTREEWESKVIDRDDGLQVPARGPYPNEGDYDWAWTMEGPKGEFRELTIARVEWIAGVLRDSEELNAYQRRVFQLAAIELQKRMQHELDLELLKEGTPAFHGKMRRGGAVTVIE